VIIVEGKDDALCMRGKFMKEWDLEKNLENNVSLHRGFTCRRYRN
jgi:hypothetical protein